MWYFVQSTVQHCQILSQSDLKRRSLRLFRKTVPATRTTRWSVPDPKCHQQRRDSICSKLESSLIQVTIITHCCQMLSMCVQRPWNHECETAASGPSATSAQMVRVTQSPGHNTSSVQCCQGVKMPLIKMSDNRTSATSTQVYMKYIK